MKTLNYMSRSLYTAYASTALLFISSANAQNVGIGAPSPQSKLTVNGNFTVGADYNTAAPTNGALVEGFVGIGTTTPLAPLHVGTLTTIQATNSTESYFQPVSTTLTQRNGVTGSDSASAIFANKIYSPTIVCINGGITASDARLKNVIGRSDNAKDLETLKKIEITDYTMKDVVNEGDAPLKKVTAQQVEKVYPTAIKTIGLKGVTFTPDIYAVASSVKSDGNNVYAISLAKAHGLKEGETVRLITNKISDLNVEVHVVNDKTFTVTTKESLGDKVFVYGKECLDLKGIDYDAISMLNVSATQELAKKVEALEAENAELKAHSNRLATLEVRTEALEAENIRLKAERDKFAALTARIEALEKSVSSQKNDSDTIRPVALNQ